MSVLSLAASAMVIPCLFTIDRARHIYRHSIVSERGIEECSYVELGGIRQYVQIRGQDISNPIILFLHGGPGNPTSCISYHYQEDLEKDYTVVNWDQRGCGRTFYECHGKDSPISAEQILDDLDQLVDYLLERFSQKRLILLGYSWGTVPGILYAKLHPEKLLCYLSVCQCVHILSGAVYIAQQTVQLAQAEGDYAFADKLARQIASFKTCDTAFSAQAYRSYAKMRELTCSYKKSKTCKPMVAYIRKGMLSPDCALRDLRWKLRQLLLSKSYFSHTSPLIQYLSMEFDLRRLSPDFQVPVYFLTSDDDRICPAEPISQYYSHITAPDKRLLRLHTQTHTLFFDEPQVFCQSVRELLRADS